MVFSGGLEALLESYCLLSAEMGQIKQKDKRAFGSVEEREENS